MNMTDLEAYRLEKKCPVALLEYLIRTYTNAGKTVLDNTMAAAAPVLPTLIQAAPSSA